MPYNNCVNTGSRGMLQWNDMFERNTCTYVVYSSTYDTPSTPSTYIQQPPP